MKIRNQLILSFSFLFVVIALLGGVGNYYIYRLSENAKAILKDNNRTLAYMQGLEEGLHEISYQVAIAPSADEFGSWENTLVKLDSIVRLQEANITERGEQNLTGQLRSRLNDLKFAFQTDTLNKTGVWNSIHNMHNLASAIYQLNQDAIAERNDKAIRAADKVFLYMILFGASAIIITLAFVFGMPRLLIRPIDTFHEAIQNIARGNYDVKVPIRENNEFGDLAKSFNLMAEKLKEYERSSYAKILQEKKRLDAIINQIHDPVIGLDDRLKVLFANPRALALLNKKKEEVIGRHAAAVAESSNLMQDLIKELLIGAAPWEEKKYSPVRIAENGAEKLFSKDVINIITAPTGEDRQVLIGHVIMLTDITEFAERDRAKTRFIATLSHELKTPVAAIDMAGGLLENQKTGNLSAEQKKYLKTIVENNARIKRTINEILDLAKIETGSIEVRTEKINVGELLEIAITGVLPFCKEKNIKIQNLSTAGESAVLADPQKTVWILNNILINAIRYSPQNDQVFIVAEDDEGSIRISVRDHGPGIKPEQINSLFKPFIRIPHDKTEGSGLGLAISKEFVEAMGGAIGLNRNYTGGAEFWIRLKKSLEV